MPESIEFARSRFLLASVYCLGSVALHFAADSMLARLDGQICVPKCRLEHVGTNGNAEKRLLL